MSVYKVERKVDTVIIEMDIALAEKVTEILGHVSDQTRHANLGGTWAMNDLYNRLIDDAEVRNPAPLCEVQVENRRFGPLIRLVDRPH